MIERIDSQRMIGNITEPEERKKKQFQEKGEGQGVSVELSRRITSGGPVNYEDLSKKVENIRAQLRKNAYEISPEKILQGLEKFLSSK